MLARIPYFFACQFSRNCPRHFFLGGGAFLYSGYTFSHYESPFPTRDGIPLVRSSLYQLVIRVKGILVCALHCVRAATSIRIAFEVFGVDTTFSESSCVSLAQGPRWLFLLSRHRKAFLLLLRSLFVNKYLCTRKSVKRTIKVVRAKRFASAWQL